MKIYILALFAIVSLRTIAMENTDINKRSGTQNGLTPLHYAALDSKLVEIKRLLSLGAQVNVLTIISKATPLHLAAGDYLHKENAIEATKLLIKAGATVEVSDWKGRTPLHFAALHSMHEVAKELMAHGANANALTHRGESPLQLARGNRDALMIRILNSGKNSL